MQDVSLLWTLGPGELLMIVIVAIFFFGPKRLPEIGKAMGDGLRSFRDASKSQLPEGEKKEGES
ncbi:MAG: twin-arginine translocase TatA/TatE family subunit [Candidatus Eremiobacteraeota bacterium]|nr:twin-arginine translocase TatA/TatE family subunit [Candidatus Eremiobacteraeota bacterium]MCW5870406.1 twin-arginine translocase TatA/TatE family subunit [Candidatus Eremiobacteraeota bacterium]